MTNKLNKQSEWEEEYWQLVEKEGNGSNITLLLHIRDLFKNTLAQERQAIIAEVEKLRTNTPKSKLYKCNLTNDQMIGWYMKEAETSFTLDTILAKLRQEEEPRINYLPEDL